MNDSIKQICALSDAFGPSGFEEDIAALVKKMLVQVKDVHEDSLHNVTAQSIKNTGNRLKVMLDAHLDEVEHNVVTAADGLVNRGGFRGDQILGVAQPNVCAVGET